jgi:L-lactate dehydrogenase complex protein LldE
MHVGGLLTRQRAGVRVLHLAEALASTGDDAPEALHGGRDATEAAR